MKYEDASVHIKRSQLNLLFYKSIELYNKLRKIFFVFSIVSVIKLITTI